jgi:hypothetical protein
MDGDGYDLTSGPAGVLFKPSPAIDTYIRTAWTSAGSDDAFLVLDRNGNGVIDDGSELFGCATPQPVPPAGQLRNGFRALAEYDTLAFGGNGNGLIDAGDAAYGLLKLWTDANHNGLSEFSELERVAISPIRTIELDYRESRRQDRYGNQFKYRAKVRDANGAQVGRWAWDVFPVVAN